MLCLPAKMQRELNISAAATGAPDLRRCASPAPTPPCLLCGGATAPALERRGFAIAGCGRCGFMFAVIPQSAKVTQLYADDEFFFGREDAPRRGARVWYDVLWERKRPFYLARFARIGQLRKPGRMLDFGCASGYMLAAARERGWQVSGVELSPEMRQRARERLACTVYESIDQALAAGERFDCIMMFDVIEHLEDPLGTVRQLRELLAPDGVLAISTMNCEIPEAPLGLPLDIWYVPPAHISYFGPATLAACVRAAGFTVAALDGVEGYCKVIAGEIAMPRWLTAILAALRRGKRPLPHGTVGKLIRKIYTGRLDLYQRRTPRELERCDILELYARRAD